MRFTHSNKTVRTVLRPFVSSSLEPVGLLAQQQVNLTAAPSSVTLPDGSSVPMWGYSCGTTVGGSTATCAKLNPTATGWSPVVITVPTGQNLTINLTNNLTFASGGIPTSLTIVGQLGGGLGTAPATTPSPAHPVQTLTWPASSSDPGDGANTPPPQGPRVRSFATEVAAGATTALTWTALDPGTYLLESGTHPSIQGPMGLLRHGGGDGPALEYRNCPRHGIPWRDLQCRCSAALQRNRSGPEQRGQYRGQHVGFSETKVWSGQPEGIAAIPASANYNTCYPPAVNYSPRYYLINGVAFDKTNAAASLFPSQPRRPCLHRRKTVLVRMVNAGLRMHVPSIVGAQTGAAPAASGFSLIAEDGNALPGIPRVQSEVFMAAGKTYDVMINVPVARPRPHRTALPIFDRAVEPVGQRDGSRCRHAGLHQHQRRRAPESHLRSRPRQRPARTPTIR